MDIARLKKLSGASGEWKEVKFQAQPKSRTTTYYNADTKNKSATDVRNVDPKSDINQDVAVTMDSSTPEHTETAKGAAEDQRHTVSVDDNGAPKVDDETEVVTSQPGAVANDGVEGRGIITDGGDELFADTVQEAASCENEEDSDDDDDDDEDLDDHEERFGGQSRLDRARAREKANESVGDFDNENTIEDSTGDIDRFQKSVSVFKDMYKVSEEEARQIIHALRGGVSRAAAKAMSKIFPSTAITNKEQLQQAASDLFDKHPELQRELMENVETKFKTEYRSLKEYFKEARS